MKTLFGYCCLVVLLAATPVRGDVSRELLDIQEQFYLNGDGRNVFPGATVLEPSLVNAFYTANGNQPAWTDRAYARQVVQLLRDSEQDGLNPADYHVEELQDLVEQYRQPASDRDMLRARTEVLLTDGVLLYAKHLIQGKVDPRTLDASWNYTRRKFDPVTTARALGDAIKARQVTQVIQQLRPDSDFYSLMRGELQRYRQLAEQEQFKPVPTDRVLRLGDRHSNVVALRRRLGQMAYLPAQSEQSDYFDMNLQQAVIRLQRDNGLDADGIVGQQSFRALNLSYRERVERLRINLDRVRWISQDVSDDFIVVNIAGFELYYIRDRELQWETPVMVGTIDTRTPVFQQRLRYLEFNPTWNTPRSLIQRGLFAKFKANPQYVLDKGYRLYDSNGAAVDPLTLDWGSYSASSFPFRVVQMPGPDNAMGRVKFMFPNRHAIYLHDTPSRTLFARSERAFSAGCIRVKEPLELARILLDDPDSWSAQQIRELVDSGVPQRVVQMEREVDVLLMYWTASPVSDSRIQFHHDIYNLDPAALAALDAPPVPSAFELL